LKEDTFHHGAQISTSNQQITKSKIVGCLQRLQAFDESPCTCVNRFDRVRWFGRRACHWLEYSLPNSAMPRLWFDFLQEGQSYLWWLHSGRSWWVWNWCFGRDFSKPVTNRWPIPLGDWACGVARHYQEMKMWMRGSSHSVNSQLSFRKFATLNPSITCLNVHASPYFYQRLYIICLLSIQCHIHGNISDTRRWVKPTVHRSRKSLSDRGNKGHEIDIVI